MSHPKRSEACVFPILERPNLPQIAGTWSGRWLYLPAHIWDVDTDLAST
jgi:hypothetical protein